ncbi:MAG: ribonuclease H-like domain-containing protein [Nanoarchaeota archaeon]
MKYLFLDIETAPLEITNEDVKNYLMDKKISKELRSFDPNYSKVIAVALKINDENVKVFHGEDEVEILKNTWEFIKESKAMIVTHNGYKFDIPFLIIRSCINNILPLNISLNPWTMVNSNHFDTMLFFSGSGSFTNPNLEILAKLNNVEVEKERVSGVDIEKLYKSKEWEKIIGRCKQDVEILEKVFNKLCKNYVESRR